MIFNRPIPQDLGFVDRTDPENILKFEVDFLVGKKQLGKIIDKCIKKHGTAITSEMLDAIKAQGYKYSTIGAITVAVCDATIPPQKQEILAKAEAEIERDYRRFPRRLPLRRRALQRGSEDLGKGDERRYESPAGRP